MENKKNVSLADRFTSKVLSAYSDVAKGVVVSEYQHKLIANYFVEIDKMLKASKQGYTWQMVRLNELSLTVAHLSRLRLDCSLPGSVSFIPFKNKDGTITLVSCIGKNGYNFIAREYGIEKLKHMTVELVYENDEFFVLKKDANHKGDSYVFNIKSPFNRGKCIGGFGFLEFDDEEKNKLNVMSLQDILKYKPANADNTFWGGKNLNDMLEKTIAKKTLKSVALDPDKVNGIKGSLEYMDAEELTGRSLEAKEEISGRNGTGEYIDIDYEDVPEDETEENVDNPVDNVEISGEITETEEPDTKNLFGE